MKKLYLSKDRKIAGVCGGVGEYFGIDPSVIRLGWIVITILTGIVPGIVAYLVAAIVIPDGTDTTQSKTQNQSH